jgi:hypothetical protein
MRANCIGCIEEALGWLIIDLVERGAIRLEHFPAKHAPGSIGGGHRFAAENATNARNQEHGPIPKERTMLLGACVMQQYLGMPWRAIDW